MGIKLLKEVLEEVTHKVMLKAHMCELFLVCLGMAASLQCAGDIKAMEQSCSGLLHLWPEGKS